MVQRSKVHRAVASPTAKSAAQMPMPASTGGGAALGSRGLPVMIRMCPPYAFDRGHWPDKAVWGCIESVRGKAPGHPGPALFLYSHSAIPQHNMLLVSKLLYIGKG